MARFRCLVHGPWMRLPDRAGMERRRCPRCDQIQERPILPDVSASDRKGSEWRNVR